MLDALAWLEWRRIRLPALLGAGAGLGIPLALVALAGRGRPGWPELLRFSAADVTETFLPAFFLLFFWPLWALVLPIHQLEADRREGTRRFLLDRPVPRWLPWLLRHLVALAALVVAVAASLAGWVLAGLAAGSGDPLSPFLVETPPLPILVLPAAVLLVVFSAGSILATLGGRSLPAVFLGGLLVLGTSLVVVVGLDVRSGAGLRLVDAFLLLLAALLLATSFAAEATGEPAGRHRLRRALLLLAGIPLLCVLAWAGSLRF